MRNPTSLPARVAGPSESDPATHELTVNLDAARHRRLKQLAAEHRLSQEELLVKALDAYLQANIK
jgi:predicted transcriptional regulator